VLAGDCTNESQNRRAEALKDPMAFCVYWWGASHPWAAAAGVVRDAAGYLVTGPDLLHQSKMPEGWPLDCHPYYLSKPTFPDFLPQATFAMAP